MRAGNFKYIYGPVPSWRLGSSLGIDPVSGEGKICTFDCVYCQLGKTKIFSDERKVFIPVAEIMEEINLLPPLQIDYITFSGAGEPTLAKNLGRMIKAVKKTKKTKIAVITNSSLIDREDLVDDLLLADFVLAKFDAASSDIFKTINRPMDTIKFDVIIQALKKFRGIYKGKLALQIMFIEENKKYAREIARIAKEINPDEVQINTPLRLCGVKPLSKIELSAVRDCFEGLNSISVYEAKKKNVESISNKNTLKRRGKI